MEAAIDNRGKDALQGNDNLMGMLDRGIDDMEAGRELPLDEAFQKISYYPFENGVRTEKNYIISYTMRQYIDNDYNFVYEVKKNAYKKYVELCWGEWNEQDQQKYFDYFINQVKDNACIIQLGNEDIGFYNGEVLENGNYEVGNICIIPEYQGKGIGSRILKDIIDRYSNTDIEIQFFKQNPVGNLYKRLGFEKSGETQFHYQMIKPKYR